MEDGVCLASTTGGPRSRIRCRRVTAPRIAVGVTVIFAAVVGYARLSGHWHGTIAEEIFFQLIPNASTFGHP